MNRYQRHGIHAQPLCAVVLLVVSAGHPIRPYYYKSRLADFPLTLAYGQKIDAFRRNYQAWLWDAQLRDTAGANATANGLHRYSV